MTTVPARSPFDSAAIAQIVARNIVPVVGIFAFGWSAGSVLMLYFADTMLSIGVMFAGLASYFTRGSAEDTWASRLNAEAGAVATAAVLVAFVAIPLGMPLLFVSAMSQPTAWRETLADPAFQAGLGWQFVAAVWSYAGLWRELHFRSPDELRLKRRFALVFLRWIVIVGATYTGFLWIAGGYAPALLVVIYAATTIFAEIAPDRFLRAMPGGAEDADPLPGKPRPKVPLPPPAKRRR